MFLKKPHPQPLSEERGEWYDMFLWCLHEVILQESLQYESIKTDNKADSHKGDIAKILKEIASAYKSYVKLNKKNNLSDSGVRAYMKYAPTAAINLNRISQMFGGFSNYQYFCVVK